MRISSTAAVSSSFFAFLISLPISGSWAAEHSSQLDPKLGKVVDQCKSQKSQQHVWIFKQWHLAPSVDTRNSREQVLPQKENQTAIYKQLQSWIAQGKLTTVLAKGCSGEINSKFDKTFNGWNYRSLTQASSRKDSYAEIVTHIPLKLEAEFKDKLRSLCADDESLIKTHDLAFSDARGISGFYSRIDLYQKDPARLKLYLEGAIEQFKLDPKSTPQDVLKKLKSELRAAVQKIKSGFQQRNQKIVQVALANQASNQALVIGGAHAADLVSQLEESQINCTVVEPTGFNNDSEKLMSELEAI